MTGATPPRWIGRRSTVGAGQRRRRLGRHRARARRGFDLRRPAPAATSASAASGWRDRRAPARALSPAALRLPPPVRRLGGLDRLFRLAVLADAEQPLLQFAVGREPRRLHDSVDAAIDHDRDFFRDRGGHADILLDDEDADVSLLADPEQHLLDLLDDDRRKALGRLVHDQEPGIEQQRARNGEHLLLAARKLVAAVAAPLRQPRERLVDARDRPLSAAVAAGETQMLVDRQAMATTACPAAHSRAQAWRSRPGCGRRALRRANRIEPLAAGMSPTIALHSVVLPMPLRPTSERMPCSSLRSTPCKA